MVLATAGAEPRPDGSGPAWTAPHAMAMLRTGPADNRQSAPTLFDNLDCTSVTYRMVAESTMRTGCFTQTAFGMLDSDDYTVIFNGTDEGLPLVPYTASQIPVPWPKAGDLAALSPLNTGGSFISLYTDPLGAMRDQRDALGRLTAKRLASPPDLTLKDPSGRPLVINPQTLAFSDGGNWMAAETLSGSFVRINLSTLELLAFAPSYGSQGSPALLKSRVALSEDGRFAAIANDAAGEFKIYDLADCREAEEGSGRDLPPRDCASHDYRSFATQNIIGLRTIRQLRFVNESLLAFGAISTDPAHSGNYELAPAARITSLTDYIGMGDSYTSGEGAFDYLAGTDTPDNTCHLSRNSYPLLLTHDLFGESGGHSVACSGAVINDIGNMTDNYRGQVKKGESLQDLREPDPRALDSIEAGFLPGYVAQHRFVKRWQPEVVTVSIGGNDIGFGDLLQNCVEPHISHHVNGNTCYSGYEDRLELMGLIDRTVPRWTDLFARLRREAPAARLYTIGYPQVALSGGDCALNVQLNGSELEFATEVIDYLNRSISLAAGAAGATYVDISRALKGHRLCEGAGYEVAVNGLTAGWDAGIFGIGILGRESYHPNALGHELIEQAILRATHDLAGSPPAVPDTKASGEALLKAPRTGRTVYALVPDDNLAPGAARRGSSLHVRATGVTDGLRPGISYLIRLDGPEGQVLGTAISGHDGNVETDVIIPDGIVPGGHTIDVTGENESGMPVNVTRPLYVTSGDSDGDGDHAEDGLDSCPGAINSGRDSDQDGIDDICDSLVDPRIAPSGPAGHLHARGLAARRGRGSGVLGIHMIKPAGRANPGDPAAGRRLLWLAGMTCAALILLSALKFNKRRGFRLQ